MPEIASPIQVIFTESQAADLPLIADCPQGKRMKNKHSPGKIIANVANVLSPVRFQARAAGPSMRG